RVPGALANPYATAVDYHAAAEDQVDRAHLVNPDGSRIIGCASAGGDRLERHCQRSWVEQVERFWRGQPRHGHVEQLAFVEGADADGQLRLVGVRLDDAR